MGTLEEEAAMSSWVCWPGVGRSGRKQMVTEGEGYMDGVPWEGDPEAQPGAVLRRDSACGLLPLSWVPKRMGEGCFPPSLFS